MVESTRSTELSGYYCQFRQGSKCVRYDIELSEDYTRLCIDCEHEQDEVESI